MNPQLLDQIDLVCPRCRRPELPGSPGHLLRLHRAEETQGEYVLEGELICSNGRCGQHYPIIRGVPLVLRDDAILARTAAQAYNSLPPTSLRPVADSLLPTYLDAHYEGECRPPRTYPWSLSNTLFWQTMRSMLEAVDPHPGAAVDLGCATGRFCFDLAGSYAQVVGVDTNHSYLAGAAALQRGEEVAFQRPLRSLAGEPVSLSRSGARNILFILADALDPPLRAESAALVAALNLLDSIAFPMILLGQMDALLKRSGSMLVASPFAWNSKICPVAQWLEEPHTPPGQVIRELLTGARSPENGFSYRIAKEQTQIPWVLPLLENQCTLFLTQAMMAQKL